MIPPTIVQEDFEANLSGCKGDNRSPALKWSGTPPQTRSFAIDANTIGQTSFTATCGRPKSH